MKTTILIAFLFAAQIQAQGLSEAPPIVPPENIKGTTLLYHPKTKDDLHRLDSIAKECAKRTDSKLGITDDTTWSVTSDPQVHDNRPILKSWTGNTWMESLCSSWAEYADSCYADSTACDVYYHWNGTEYIPKPIYEHRHSATFEGFMDFISNRRLKARK